MLVSQHYENEKRSLLKDLNKIKGSKKDCVWRDGSAIKSTGSKLKKKKKKRVLTALPEYKD